MKNEKAQFRGCCVEHTERMKGVINCSAFKTIMQDLRSQLEELWKHNDKLLVVCADTQGMHRSVAVAALLKHLCEKKGFISKGPHHLSRESWQKRKSVPRASTVGLTKKRKIVRSIATRIFMVRIFYTARPAHRLLLVFTARQVTRQERGQRLQAEVACCICYMSCLGCIRHSAPRQEPDQTSFPCTSEV